MLTFFLILFAPFCEFGRVADLLDLLLGPISEYYLKALVIAPKDHRGGVIVFLHDHNRRLLCVQSRTEVLNVIRHCLVELVADAAEEPQHHEALDDHARVRFLRNGNREADLRHHRCDHFHEANRHAHVPHSVILWPGLKTFYPAQKHSGVLQVVVV